MYATSNIETRPWIMKNLGLPRKEDVLFSWFWDDPGQGYHCPKFVLFVDELSKSVVLSIRGTKVNVPVNGIANDFHWNFRASTMPLRTWHVTKYHSWMDSLTRECSWVPPGSLGNADKLSWNPWQSGLGIDLSLQAIPLALERQSCWQWVSCQERNA